MLKKRCQINSDGFTLIEVLIALAIFAIGILGIATMQISSTNGNTGARKHSEASEFAQGQVDLLMATSFADLADGALVTASGYTVIWTVDPDNNAVDLDGDGNDDLIQIIVVVTDPSGSQRSSLTFTKSSGI
ncbi:MAG: prepilin-type N-terminal cleavage/methylation domain-containing protein [Desulfobacteraceae bacterium]|nr:prepilin-type N-terminal cleavage/methylation domain-containing protein [Desulfobacteraceae bacterium]